MVKIGNILQDQSATNFLIVCIAEFLSINESQRLLQELQRNSVRVSHVVVNQLVQGWVSDAEMPAFDKLLARADPRPDEDELLSVSASFNTLSLVHRDEGLMRFVKYVSHLAPSSRWDVAMQYTVEGIDDSDEEEDDDGGEENGEGEELE